jgi:hypothetical protein
VVVGREMPGWLLAGDRSGDGFAECDPSHFSMSGARYPGDAELDRVSVRELLGALDATVRPAGFQLRSAEQGTLQVEPASTIFKWPARTPGGDPAGKDMAGDIVRRQAITERRRGPSLPSCQAARSRRSTAPDELYERALSRHHAL